MLINTVYEGDCRQVLADFETESFDGAFTDPPYNVNLKPQRQTHDGIINDNLRDDEFALFNEQAFKHVYRVLKNNTVCWVCCNWQSFSVFESVLKNIGFCIANTVVWVKQVFGLGWHFRPQHEFILVCFKGEPPVPKQAISNVWMIDRLMHTIHPTEKPVSLVQKALLQYNNTEDLILDPFAGSGSTCAAAKQIGMNYVGIEQDTGYYKLCTERLFNSTVTVTNKKGKLITRHESRMLDLFNE